MKLDLECSFYRSIKCLLQTAPNTMRYLNDHHFHFMHMQLWDFFVEEVGDHWYFIHMKNVVTRKTRRTDGRLLDKKIPSRSMGAIRHLSLR